MERFAEIPEAAEIHRFLGFGDLAHSGEVAVS